jgi:predicted AAA+ superfamily ATPase
MTNIDYKPRELTRIIERHLQVMPVVVLTGMRQTGKTTLLCNEPSLRSRRFINLDDFAQLEAARRDPEGLFRGEEPVTVDEAQRAPELLMAVKKLVDESRVPGRFLLSGSANFSLIKGVSESLAGRATYLNLRPFSFRELKRDLEGRPFLVEFLESLSLADREAPVFDMELVMKGGLPPVCLGLASDPWIWFLGYEQTYLERDVRDLLRVADLATFRRFLHLLAYRSGAVLRISELARDTGISVATASRYLGVLEASFIVDRLHPYLASRATRLVKSSKIMLGDSGLGCFLTGVKERYQEPFFGAMLETYVAQSLAAILETHLSEAGLFYWHVQGRYEVDFVIEWGMKVVAIEVKAASRWSPRDLKSLRAFLKSTPDCHAAVLAYTGTEAVSLGDRLWAIPLGMLLS